MLAPITARIQLNYRDDLHLLVGRWLTDATLAEFQAEYTAVLTAAQAHNAWRWLLDVRRRPLPPAGSVEWLNEVLMPQASAAAPKHLCVAYLVSPQRMQAVSTDDRLRAAVVHLAEGMPHSEVRMFNDEGEAMRWLTGQEAH